MARPGGDEFAVLVVEAVAAALRAVTARVRSGLDAAGVAASVAGAVRSDAEELVETWARADRAMYAVKRRAHTPHVGDGSSADTVTDLPVREHGTMTGRGSASEVNEPDRNAGAAGA